VPPVALGNGFERSLRRLLRLFGHCVYSPLLAKTNAGERRSERRCWGQQPVQDGRKMRTSTWAHAAFSTASHHAATR